MQCFVCKKNKKHAAFATYTDRKGVVRRRGICLICKNKKSAKYAQENFERLQQWRKNYNQRNKGKKKARGEQVRSESRALVDSYKSRPCIDCGKRWPPVAMDLDHVRGAKTMDIARMVCSSYRLELIKEELKKCDVVCACCHRLRTATRKQNHCPSRNPALGSKHPCAKLGEKEAASVRKRYYTGETQAQIAADLDVSGTTVSQIVNGKLWKHLDQNH